MDYSGNVCGTDFGDIDMTNYPKIVYINQFLGGVCVEECPVVDNLVDPATLLTYNGVYQGDGAVLPYNYVNVADYSNVENVLTCDDSICNTDPSFSWTRLGISEGYGFAYYAMDTYEVLGVRCITNPAASLMLKTIVQMENDPLDIEAWTNTQEFFGNLYGDIFAARYYVMAFGIAASMVSLLWKFHHLLNFLFGRFDLTNLILTHYEMKYLFLYFRQLVLFMHNSFVSIRLFQIDSRQFSSRCV
jgi:hypothetical protein